MINSLIFFASILQYGSPFLQISSVILTCMCLLFTMFKDNKFDMIKSLIIAIILFDDISYDIESVNTTIHTVTLLGFSLSEIFVLSSFIKFNLISSKNFFLDTLKPFIAILVIGLIFPLFDLNIGYDRYLMKIIVLVLLSSMFFKFFIENKKDQELLKFLLYAISIKAFLNICLLLFGVGSEIADGAYLRGICNNQKSNAHSNSILYQFTII